MPLRNDGSRMASASGVRRRRPPIEKAMLIHGAPGAAGRAAWRRRRERRTLRSVLTSRRVAMEGTRRASHERATGVCPSSILSPSRAWYREPKPGRMFPWISSASSTGSAGAPGISGPVITSESGSNSCGVSMPAALNAPAASRARS